MTVADGGADFVDGLSTQATQTRCGMLAERLLVNELPVWARRLPECAVRADGVAAATAAIDDGVMAEDKEAAM